MRLPLVQVAGVIDEAEGRVLAAAGVTHAGFPLRLPVNTPDTSERRAKEIIAALPPSLIPVLITYLDTCDDIIDFCRDMNCFTIQLHGPVSIGELEKLRRMTSRLTVFKSLVIGENEVNDLIGFVAQAHPFVDAFITDTFDPVSGASGATGHVHDWLTTRRLVEESPKPVILAGGLTARNVAAGIQATGCAGVDTHTGLEGPDGRKIPEAVRAFVDNARAAWRGLRESVKHKALGMSNGAITGPTKRDPVH
ncbi:MAG: phosphoribosylanthranilate isomerase [Lentisphaeria bacterium]|nr:phosphoribosylanthranilate isomerase [Lentisphaeria bacterium]